MTKNMSRENRGLGHILAKTATGISYNGSSAFVRSWWYSVLKELRSTDPVKNKLWLNATLWDSLLALVAASLGLLLSRAVIMGELYPFGISFLAAVSINRPRWRKLTLLGVVAGILFSVRGVSLLSYLAGDVLVYLILLRYTKRENRWALVPGLVLTVHLLTRGIPLLLSGNDVYLWVSVIFESFFAGVLTLVCNTGIQALPRLSQGYTLSPEERTSLGIILLGSLAGVASIQIFQLSLQSILSRCLVLCGGLLAGPGGGAAIGVAVGLIPSIQGSLNTGPIAFYALAGLLGGIFNSFGKIGVIIGFTLGNLLLTLFFAEQAVIVLSFWESGLAILICLILPLAKLRDHLGQAKQKNAAQPDITDQTSGKLFKISQVFSELARIFQSSTPKEENHELTNLINRVAIQVCDGCALNKVCWEQDFYKTYRALLEAYAKLEKTGAINERDFNQDLQRRCRRLRELNLTLNSQAELTKLETNYQKKLGNAAALIKQQLNGVSQLVLDFSQELKTEVLDNQEVALYLQEKLRVKGLRIKKIEVSNRADCEQEFTVHQEDCLEKNWCKSMVAPHVSQLLDKTYKASNLFCGDNGCSFRLVPSPAYQVIVGKAQCAKEGEKVSGDVCTAINIPDHRTLLLLSDGMGTGEEALQESKTAVDLIEKMLLSGFAVETALKTVNTALYLRSGQERFATLDIVIINRVNGQADFIKLGGSPSLICSLKGIRIVKGATPPAGILENIEVNNIRKVLGAGSILIMMSDGVWEAVYSGGGPSAWLDKIMNEEEYENPHKMASYLLYLAKKATGNKAKDDMCIQVAWLNETDIA